MPRRKGKSRNGSSSSGRSPRKARREELRRRTSSRCSNSSHSSQSDESSFSTLSSFSAPLSSTQIKRQIRRRNQRQLAYQPMPPHVPRLDLQECQSAPAVPVCEALSTANTTYSRRQTESEVEESKIKSVLPLLKLDFQRDRRLRHLHLLHLTLAVCSVLSAITMLQLQFNSNSRVYEPDDLVDYITKGLVSGCTLLMLFVSCLRRRILMLQATKANTFHLVPSSWKWFFFTLFVIMLHIPIGVSNGDLRFTLPNLGGLRHFLGVSSEIEIGDTWQLIVVLRLFVAVRVLRDYSIPYKWRRAHSTSSADTKDEGPVHTWGFTLRTLFYHKPTFCVVTVLVALVFGLSYALYIAEREKHVNPIFDLSTAISVAFGNRTDVALKTAKGHVLSLLAILLGILWVGLTFVAIQRALQLTGKESSMLEWTRKVRTYLAVREVAATTIQNLWRGKHSPLKKDIALDAHKREKAIEKEKHRKLRHIARRFSLPLSELRAAVATRKQQRQKRSRVVPLALVKARLENKNPQQGGNTETRTEHVVDVASREASNDIEHTAERASIDINHGPDTDTDKTEVVSPKPVIATSLTPGLKTEEGRPRSEQDNSDTVRRQLAELISLAKTQQQVLLDLQSKVSDIQARVAAWDEAEYYEGEDEEEEEEE